MAVSVEVKMPYPAGDSWARGLPAHPVRKSLRTLEVVPEIHLLLLRRCALVATQAQHMDQKYPGGLHVLSVQGRVRCSLM